MVGGAIVVANRNKLGPWETFGISVSASGLISLQASNGKYVCAEQSGLLQANRASVGEWEMFRVVSPEAANEEETRIEVNVYKIGTAPLWHTGTVIDGREYYFQTNNRVQECAPRGMGLPMHRTIVRFVPGSLQRVKSILGQVSGRWNGTRYDLTSHNCNFFTNDLLTALGTTGLDREYMDASQMAKVLRQTPGSSTVQEVLVKLSWFSVNWNFDRLALAG